MQGFLSPARALALLRMGFGLYFLGQSYNKATTGWLTTGVPLARMLRQSLPRALPLYRSFLESTVIPHAALFSRLVTLGEGSVGLCLLLGLLTPAAAVVGIWLNLNYMCMKGLPNVAGSSDRLFILAELMFLLTSAGLVWGLDGVIWRRIAHRPSIGRSPAPLGAAASRGQQR